MLCLLIPGACYDDTSGRLDTDSGSSSAETDPTTDPATTETTGTTGSATATESGSTTLEPTSTSSASASTTTGDTGTGESTGTTGEIVEEPEGISGAYLYASADSFTVWDMVAHPDGGVVIVGNVLLNPNGTSNREASIAHIDDAGAVVWARRTNWSTNDQFFATVVRGQSVLGVGLSRRPGGAGNTDQILISEFGLDGTYEGSVIFGGASDEHGWDAVATSDGGLAISGFSTAPGFGDRDGMLLKLDGDLQQEWAIGLGGSQRDILRSIFEDADGGFVVVGELGRSATTSDSLIAKIDSTGALEFSSAFGDGGTDILRGAAPLPQGGYLVAGQTTSWGAGALDGVFGVFAPGADPELTLWTMGSSGDELFTGLLALGDGRFITVGHAGSVPNGDDAWLGRIDTTDEIGFDWNFVYDSPREQRNLGGSVALRNDGGLAVGMIDLETPADTLFSPAVLFTDSLGGFADPCPTETADTFDPSPVGDVASDGTINEVTLNFTRSTLAPGGEPVIDLDLGMRSSLCE